MASSLAVVDVEQPVDGEIDAERHRDLRRILGGYVLVDGGENRDHIGNVDELVVLRSEAVRVELFQCSREAQQVHCVGKKQMLIHRFLWI